jgi:threonine aldolase
MPSLTRRHFFQTGTALAVLGSPGLLARSAAGPAPNQGPGPRPVSFMSDGLSLSPGDYTRLLVSLEQAGKTAPDSYLEGGAVEALESQMAKLLGKEKAVFMPSGTLANHLALRRLAGGKSRVIVPAESHIYCDTLDCVQSLSQLNLIPLGEGRATYTAQEVEAACQRAVSGPFPTPVGALAIESPVRRRDGAMFDFEEMKRVAAYAKKSGLKMHLDGARLFLASAWTGRAPAEFAALFDTVYVSLYKCFNAGSGAVLAGPRDLIEQAAHDRKLFGGTILHAWTFAAVASHYLDGYLERMQSAVAVARELFELLAKNPRFRVESVPQGTNVYRLHVQGGGDLAAMQATLKARGIDMPRPSRAFTGFELRVNESLYQRRAADLARLFA